MFIIVLLFATVFAQTVFWPQGERIGVGDGYVPVFDSFLKSFEVYTAVHPSSPNPIAGSASYDACFVSGMDGYKCGVVKSGTEWYWHTFGEQFLQTCMFQCIRMTNKPTETTLSLVIINQTSVTEKETTPPGAENAIFCGLRSVSYGYLGYVAKQGCYLSYNGQYKVRKGVWPGSPYTVAQCEFFCLQSSEMVVVTVDHNSFDAPGFDGKDWPLGSVEMTPIGVPPTMQLCTWAGGNDDFSAHWYSELCVVGPYDQEDGDYCYASGYFMQNINTDCHYLCAQLAFITPPPSLSPTPAPTSPPSPLPSAAPSPLPTPSPTRLPTPGPPSLYTAPSGTFSVSTSSSALVSGIFNTSSDGDGDNNRSAEEKEEEKQKQLFIIIAASAGGVLLLFSLCACCCLSTKSKKSRSGEQKRLSSQGSALRRGSSRTSRRRPSCSNLSRTSHSGGVWGGVGGGGGGGGSRPNSNIFSPISNVDQQYATMQQYSSTANMYNIAHQYATATQQQHYAPTNIYAHVGYNANDAYAAAMPQSVFSATTANFDMNTMYLSRQ